MRKALVQFLLVISMTVAPIWAGEKQPGDRGGHPPPEDLEVIAAMEILNMLELATDMEMIEDMEYLVKEDQNERINEN